MAFRKSTEKPAAKNDGRCEWNAEGLRCKYPGSFSFNNLGAGPWYCRWHSANLDPISAAQIVLASQDYVPETSASRMLEVQREADAYCKANGLVRKDGESRAEFHERRRAFFKQKLQGFLRKSELEKQPA